MAVNVIHVFMTLPSPPALVSSPNPGSAACHFQMKLCLGNWNPGLLTAPPCCSASCAPTSHRLRGLWTPYPLSGESIPPPHQYLCGCPDPAVAFWPEQLPEPHPWSPEPLLPMVHSPSSLKASRSTNGIMPLPAPITPSTPITEHITQTPHKESHLSPAHLAPHWPLVFLLQSHSLTFCFSYRPSSSSFPFVGVPCWPFLSLPGLCEAGHTSHHPDLSLNKHPLCHRGLTH